MASLKSLNSVPRIAVPWVPKVQLKVFLARGGNFRCWPKPDTSSAVARSHEPDGNRAKKTLWHPGGQGFESRTSLNFFLAFFRNCEKLCQKCDDLLSYNSADFFKSLKNFRGERFCRAPLGQMFNSWCISCTIYSIHSRDWRLGLTILWTII